MNLFYNSRTKLRFWPIKYKLKWNEWLVSEWVSGCDCVRLHIWRFCPSLPHWLLCLITCYNSFKFQTLKVSAFFFVLNGYCLPQKPRLTRFPQAISLFFFLPFLPFISYFNSTLAPNSRIFHRPQTLFLNLELELQIR